MKTIKGPAFFWHSSQATSTFQYSRKHGPLGRWPRFRRHPDSQLGPPASSTLSWPPKARPIATKSLASLPARASAITELSTHLQGQLVASNPAFDVLLEGFAPAEPRS